VSFFAWFLLISLVELAAFIWVQSVIGLGWALFIALATAVIGSYAVKKAGLSAFRRLRDRLGEGSVPAQELVDGAAILVAGAFLISPGLISDALGFILLIPAVRAFVYRVVSKRFANRVSVFSSYASGSSATTERWPQGEIIDIEEVE
jgi:UPF0716 protein FxsA